jgi:hypothetical protein
MSWSQWRQQQIDNAARRRFDWADRLLYWAIVHPDGVAGPVAVAAQYARHTSGPADVAQKAEGRRGDAFDAAAKQVSGSAAAEFRSQAVAAYRASASGPDPSISARAQVRELIDLLELGDVVSARSLIADMNASDNPFHDRAAVETVGKLVEFYANDLAEMGIAEKDSTPALREEVKAFKSAEHEALLGNPRPATPQQEVHAAATLERFAAPGAPTRWAALMAQQHLLGRGAEAAERHRDPNLARTLREQQRAKLATLADSESPLRAKARLLLADVQLELGEPRAAAATLTALEQSGDPLPTSPQTLKAMRARATAAIMRGGISGLE